MMPKLSYRKITEKKIGRRLKPGEIVHHIDGDSTNDDPENLCVCKNQTEHLLLQRRVETSWDIKAQELMDEAMGGISFKASQQFSEALSSFFTKRQLELIFRKALHTNGGFSKTEGEYYSRTIKKKLIAIQRLNRFKQLLDVLLD
jgi:hypothetical protein